MISIADLVKDTSFKGNYFAPDAYLQGDYELGLLETRKGSRLIALPEVLLQGIFVALEAEIGQASSVVLYNCGRWWGKNFYRRFIEEVSEYYETPLAKMQMVEFISCFKQCWKTHGWGVMDFDFDYYENGFIVVQSWNSPFANNIPEEYDRQACFMEAGILSAFFSQLTGKNLGCIQTSCESQGAEYNHFVLGLEERIKLAQGWLDEEQDHPTIMERLLRSTTTS